MDLVERKARLRARMAELRKALSPTAAEQAAHATATRLAESGLLERRRTLALYCAVRGELSCAPLQAHAATRGLRVAFPRVLAHSLEFAVCSPAELVPGAFGVPAPPAEAATVVLGEGDVVVAPALAFDEAGGRLGHGGGYYDRAFVDPDVAADSLRVCVGYDFQRVSEVPMGAHDQPVHWLVTEAGVWRTTEGERER